MTNKLSKLLPLTHEERARQQAVVVEKMHALLNGLTEEGFEASNLTFGLAMSLGYLIATLPSEEGRKNVAALAMACVRESIDHAVTNKLGEGSLVRDEPTGPVN